jgi:hypothetical protein
MAQVPLRDASGDPDYVRGMATYCVTNFTQILMQELSKLTSLDSKHVTSLFQLPFTLMEQLLATKSDHETPSEHLKFQTKLMHILVDFNLDTYHEFKKLKSDDSMKVALGFLVEALILASGSEQPAGSTLSLSLA